MHDMNPGKKFNYNKYVDGQHVGVITKSSWQRTLDKLNARNDYVVPGIFTSKFI
jgi:hypothetical protein